MGRRLIVHLGVHKTATTHLQSFLEKERASLAKEGVAYFPLMEFRKKLTGPLNKSEAFPEEALTDLLRPLPEGSTVLLSDENLTGLVRQMRWGNLYRHSKKAAGFAHSPLFSSVDFVLTLRSQARLIPSLYSEFIRHNSFRSIEEYASEDHCKQLRYRERFAWLEGLPSHARIHVIPFEKEAGGGTLKTGELIFQLATQDPKEAARLAKAYAKLPRQEDRLIARPSFNEAEVAFFQKTKTEQGDEAAREAVEKVDSGEICLEAPPYRPLSPELQTLLKKEYEQDLRWAEGLETLRSN